MRYLLGVDVGSYSSKGVLLDEGGSVVASAQRRHEMRVPAPGRAEHDAEADWWMGFRALSRTLLHEHGVDPKDIAAVGCSGIGPCMLPVDAEGRPLRPAVLYGIDTRARDEIAALDAELDGDAIFALCGNALTSQSIGPKIRWLQRNEPEIFAKTKKIATCSTYLTYRLTGTWAIDHYTASCFTPLYDIRGRCWSETMTRAICPMEWLPDLAWSSDVIGRVDARGAAETGLAVGTPVVAGTVDSASEALSVGVQNAGDLMIMYGTTAFFIQVNGTLNHWLRDEIFALPNENAAFEAMARDAERSPPGANGLVVLPFFSGERTPINDPFARGMIFGLTLSHTRADLTRAVMEGVGHAVRHNLETFAEAGTPSAVYAVGGGVQNAMWMQAVSDIAKTEQLIRRHTTGAALGSAFLAGLGARIFARHDIDRINPLKSRVSPQAGNFALYDRDHRIYLELYARTKDLMPELWTRQV